MPRKAAPPPQPNEPLKTYGCQYDLDYIRAKAGSKAQFVLDQWAFSHPKIAVDFGAPPREDLFWKIAEAVAPGYFVRDPWSERIVNAACNYDWVGLAGCAGCVSGETRLLNPITGEQPTFEYLHRNKIAPLVMTLEGPMRACVPFIKGVEELFEVRLSDGSSFCSTKEHRVLTPHGYREVASLCHGQRLFSYAPILRGSNLERGHAIRALDALYSQKTKRDFRENYSPGLNLCGEQLHCAQEADQFYAPSLNGAPSSNRENLHSGEMACKSSRSPYYQQPFHPSSLDFCNPRNSWGIPERHLLDLKTGERADRLCQPLLQSASKKSFRSPSGLPNPYASNRQNAVVVDHLKGGSIQDSCCYSVVQSYITSIRATGKRIFYDISVPGPQHYFAEGVIHHNSAKTWNVTGFGVIWWLCDPFSSSILICSTTAKALRKRNWANVQKMHSLIPGIGFGNFVDSRLQWQSKKGDDLCAISGIAVEEGDTKAAADKIKGTHTKRQMVIINEANSVNAGIWEAIYNLHSYPEQCGGEFIVLAEANPSSWLDEFGKFTEPDKGVSSVTVDTEEWETKPQLNGKKGICVRFDVEKTPNLNYPADRPINKHLPSRDQAERCMRSPDRDSPTYWSNKRGFPPPEGLNKNVFSEVTLETSHAYDKHRFTGERFQIIGAFDPSRGGDKPTLRFGALGEIESGDLGIEWMAPIVIPVNVSLKNPIDYQILEQVRNECEHVQYRGTKTSCPPGNLGVDATGGGADFCDIANRNWSFDIMRIVFSESASLDAASHEDIRPAKEVYRNKRAQMYFQTNYGIASGQIKGLDRETAREMCTIEYDDSKVLRVIISKQDYKLKFKKSPDATDSGIILTEVARRKGFKLAVQGQTKHRYQNNEDVFKKSQAIYHDTYSMEEVSDEETYAAIGGIE